MRIGEDQLRTGENWLAGEKWDNMWQNFRHTAFRLETLPEYRVAQEREVLDQLNKGILPPGYNQEWHDKLAGYRRDGKRVVRVRIMDSPITEYQRHQVNLSYPANVRAGEEIFILPAAVASDLGLARKDFWLFDDVTTVQMHYQPNGTQIGREIVSEDTSEYIAIKKVALENSIPLSEYNG